MASRRGGLAMSIRTRRSGLARTPSHARRAPATARRLRHVGRSSGPATSGRALTGAVQRMDGIRVGGDRRRPSRDRWCRGRREFARARPQAARRAERRVVRLAMRGHLLAARQIADAVRRAWWPIVLVGSLVSRRMRWIALASVVADVRATPTDVAYGWGVWSGMVRHRTCGPIVPRFSAWPGRRPRSQ